MKNPIFALETFEPKAPETTLEGHLVATAQRWIDGKGNVHPISLVGLVMLLQREHNWYVIDKPSKIAVDIWIGPDPSLKDAIYIKAANRTSPSARITATVHL